MTEVKVPCDNILVNMMWHDTYHVRSLKDPLPSERWIFWNKSYQSVIVWNSQMRCFVKLKLIFSVKHAQNFGRRKLCLGRTGRWGYIKYFSRSLWQRVYRWAEVSMAAACELSCPKNLYWKPLLSHYLLVVGLPKFCNTECDRTQIWSVNSILIKFQAAHFI